LGDKGRGNKIPSQVNYKPGDIVWAKVDETYEGPVTIICFSSPKYSKKLLYAEVMIPKCFRKPMTPAEQDLYNMHGVGHDTENPIRVPVSELKSL
jgi:hypothetical protein